jgi:hypothetical protein
LKQFQIDFCKPNDAAAPALLRLAVANATVVIIAATFG